MSAGLATYIKGSIGCERCGIYIAGVVLVLLLPLLLSVCVYRWRCRHKQRQGAGRLSTVADDESDEDDDGVNVQGRGGYVPATVRRVLDMWRAEGLLDGKSRAEQLDAASMDARSSELVQVHFHMVGACERAHAPFDTELCLGGKRTAPQIFGALANAYASEVGGSSTEAGLPLVMIVEYRGALGKMMQLTSRSEACYLTAAKSLWATVGFDSAGGGAALSSPDGGSRRSAAACGLEDDDSPMVDLSLASCCGVNSTYGGLTLASESIRASDIRADKLRDAELKRFRNAIRAGPKCSWCLSGPRRGSWLEVHWPSGEPR